MLVISDSLITRLRRRCPDIAASVIDEAFRTVEASSSITGGASTLARERSVDVCQVLLRAQLELVADSPLPSERELAYVRSCGREAAQDGTSLHVVSSSFTAGQVALTAAMWQASRPQDARTALRLTEWSLSALGVYLPELGSGFSDVTPAQSEHYRLRERLVSLLSVGVVDEKLASDCRVEIAEAYWIIAVRGELRSSLRTPQGIADKFTDILFADDGRNHLIGLAADADGQARKRLNLVASACRRTEPDCGIGVAHAAKQEQLPESVDEAKRVANLARLGRVDGIATLDMVLPEAAIVASPPLTPQLLRMARSLESAGDLLETLACLYANDLARQTTADRLGIHRRTLTYRLAKVAQLTGIDPLTVRGVRTFHAVLVAHRLDGESGIH